MRLALLDPLVTLSLDPARLADVFRGRGAKPPFDGDSPLERARAVFAMPVDDALGRDLDDIERFATERGARALVEAGRAQGRDITRWPLDASPPTLAACLVVARADNTALAGVFRRARLRLDRALADVPSFDLLAKAPRAPAKEPDERLRTAFRKVLGKDLVDVFAVEDDATGDVHGAVLFLGPPSARAVQKRGQIAADASRPVTSLRFTYDPDAARLSVKTDLPDRLFAIGAACGEALFGDATHFSDKPSFTLKPLQIGGAASVEKAALPDGVVRARIVGVQCDTLAGARVEGRGPAAWDAVADRAGLVGYLTRVTLRLDLAGEEHPVDAFLQLPHRFDVSERRCARLVRRTVAALGWMDPGTLPDDAWTLAPWAHPEWRWVEVLGSAEAFRALVAAKLVAKKRGARVAGQDFRRLGASYVTFEVPGEAGTRYALAEDPSTPARDVREEELVVWELDAAKLAAKMRRELGATPAEREVAGVVDLGVVAMGGAKVRFFYAMQAGDKGLAGRIVAGCTKGAVPVVLAPAGRRVSDGIRHVELGVGEQLGVVAVTSVLARVAAALELEEERIHPLQVAGDADVVVERATQRVWIRGVEMRALAERSYRMIECLALRAGQVVDSKEVGIHIAGKRGWLDNVARKVRPDLLKRVEKSFGDAGVAVPEGVLERLVVVEGKGGYRMALRARVI